MGWLATDAMREELSRVLGYPQIASRLTRQALAPETVLSAFDAQVCVVDRAPKAPVTCNDVDDQKFIDLAVAHRATLISKDAHILRMTKRLLKAAQRMELADLLDVSASYQANCHHTADHQRAMDALLDRTTAAFKGD